ncbi:MAG: Na/Pi cotransporter family protein [Flavobacteriales bacterium]|nr:Na/Pi cotransporter family protein [Flavobacteriales bacterium]MCB9191662.1 Na/Pi cotransporter family protein [Flavobacteriales bacterium]MCB9203684.1 Na/Pi cotransporter family protein [Flavobacteriales bacterium]
MKFGLLEILQLIGALGFFIYGMKVMSDGIQKVAGSKMRDILEAMTSNRVLGLLTGFMVTALVQSSSATTVMIVSFVNAGLLSLVESIGVIMGANIGTTITAWLISILGFKVKISALALPIIAVGFPMLFSSRDRINSWAHVLIGFALLFMGLDELKNSVPDLKSNPEILSFLQHYADLGYLSTFIFIIVGTVLTLVVQSSSAAMALTLVMCNEGWIPFELAAAMVLGENIGTTITANLAALVGNIHAKRAAGAHFIFNVFGVIWMFVVFPFFLKGIAYYMGNFMQMFPSSESANYNPEHIPIALSIFHTSFNILNVLMLIWFVPFIAKTVTRIIPSKGDDEDFSLEFIGRGLVQTPDISLAEAENEIVKFAKINQKGVQKISDLIEETEHRTQQKLLKKIKEYEEHTDLIELKVGEFLMELSRLELSNQGSRRVQSLLAVINHMESIGDVYYQMSRSIEQKIEKKIWFDESHRNDLREMRDLVFKSMEIMKPALRKKADQVNLEAAIEIEKQINQMRDRFKAKIFKKIEKGKTNLETGLIYMDLINGYEKIADHVIHVSQALRGDHLDLEDEVTT